MLTLPFSRSQLVAGVAGGEGAAGLPQQRMALYAAAGHFTCSTSTKVQLLTQRALLGCAFPRNVAYVSAMAGRYSVYLLLYWYGSTNTDAACGQSVG